MEKNYKLVYLIILLYGWLLTYHYTNISGDF